MSLIDRFVRVASYPSQIQGNSLDVFSIRCSTPRDEGKSSRARSLFPFALAFFLKSPLSRIFCWAANCLHVSRFGMKSTPVLRRVTFADAVADNGPFYLKNLLLPIGFEPSKALNGQNSGKLPTYVSEFPKPHSVPLLDAIRRRRSFMLEKKRSSLVRDKRLPAQRLR
ncbi:MAG: hypothetical protein RLZZ519_3391 [Bacteroidota bacterium]